ncbi:MAG: phosphotransferase [Oscillospiraceae bacterium]|nr:phosphotransferase [Oscillospiraceae bacterium]
MRYQNADHILPKELVRAIQQYVQGEYLYIPAKGRSAISVTGYRMELEKRDARIYSKHLAGMRSRRLAEKYSLSESSIRRIVLKQRRAYMAMAGKISQILFHWGLQDADVRQIYDTVWQVGGDRVLKVYQDSDMLERNLKIVEVLGGMQIPVGKIVPADDGRQYAAEDGAFYFLSEKLPGGSLKEFQDIGGIADMMGEIIARLHIAFQKCESHIAFWHNSLLDEMNGWVRQRMEGSGWQYVSREEFDAAVSGLAAVYGELPVQPIHRDVHFGNFLFADGKFSGYIDFDLSQKNIRIFDLCYFLLGLLSEEEKLGITEEQWFSFAGDVFAGYASRLELSPAERAAAPCVMECIELLCAAYFDSVQDIRCAEDACKLFKFVRDRERRILDAVR